MNGRNRRIMVTMPLHTAEEVHRHRIDGRFRSENAALVDLIESGLDWFENIDAYREEKALLARLRCWGQCVP